MKTKSLSLFLSLFLVAGIALMTGCDKEEETPVFTLVSLMTDGGIDLAGVSQATDVPEDALIVATFSSAVDVASATAANFEVVITEGSVATEYTIAASGAAVTLTPTSGWDGGTQFSVNLSTAIEGTNGVAFAGNSLSFRTSGIFVPQNDMQVLFLSFDDGVVEDETGMQTVSTVKTVGFDSDRRGTANASAYFDGEGNMVEIAASDDLIEGSKTISFWFKTDLNDYDGGDGTGKPQTRFLMGLGAEKGYFLEVGRRSNDPGSDAFNEMFLKMATNHVNVGNNAAAVPEATAWTEVNSQLSVGYEAGVSSGYTTVLAQLSEDPPNRSYITGAVSGKWTHMVMTVDAAAQEKSIYVNGVKWLTFKWLESGFDWLFADLSLKDKDNTGADWPNPIDGDLAIGFGGSQANKATGWMDYEATDAAAAEAKKFFKGYVDQFRIFSVPLNDAEVTSLYDNEK